MTRILLRSSKSPFQALTVEEVLQRKVGGANLGNLVFSDSAYKILSTPDTEINFIGFQNRNYTAEEINEKYDYFVLPFANAFRPAFCAELDRWTDLIGKLRIPVVVLGIGAQSTLDYDLEPLRPLDASVRRFAAAVLDRGPSIGVRGEFTQHYLNHLGFKDVEVIGCPSLFRYGNSLDVEKRAATLDIDARIGMSVTGRTMNDLGRIVMDNHRRYPNLTYLGQDISDLELMYWGDTSREAGEHRDMPELRSHPLFLENRVRLHLDPVTWIRELGGYDFVFGTRIHGNIVSLLGGTPSVVMCHDSRTLELSRYFDIPHRMMTEPAEAFDAARLYEEADYTALVKGHSERFDRMMGFVESHGLKHVFQERQDGGAAFEERIADIEFAPPVEVWSGDDDGLEYRFGRLHESVRGLTKKLSKAQKQQAAQEQRLALLETRLSQADKRLTTLEGNTTSSTGPRAWRNGKQALRRLGLRR